MKGMLRAIALQAEVVGCLFGCNLDHNLKLASNLEAIGVLSLHSQEGRFVALLMP
jgi:hypothetical protein